MQQDFQQQDPKPQKKTKLGENPAEKYAIVNNRLPREFYTVGVVELAQQLCGKIIVRNLPQGQVKALIVECEAYKAPEDKACHAYNNKKTERTQYFWQDGGHLYIYSIYGNNYCLNVTAKTKNDPEAVLIRGVQIIEGIAIVKELRKMKSNKLQDLSNGPGKVGACLQLDKSHNAIDLVNSQDIYIIDNSVQYEIEASKRINIDYAEEWTDMLWRFTIKGNSYVSKGK
ncbi:hypothetical protein pb186bvf_000630 [Paramecium bursaria]